MWPKTARFIGGPQVVLAGMSDLLCGHQCPIMRLVGGHRDCQGMPAILKQQIPLPICRYIVHTAQLFATAGTKYRSPTRAELGEVPRATQLSSTALAVINHDDGKSTSRPEQLQLNIDRGGGTPTARSLGLGEGTETKCRDPSGLQLSPNPPTHTSNGQIPTENTSQARNDPAPIRFERYRNTRFPGHKLAQGADDKTWLSII